MAEPLHTIRFKRGSVEFQLTSTAAEVAKILKALEPTVIAELTRADGERVSLDAELQAIATNLSDIPEEPVLEPRRQLGSAAPTGANGGRRAVSQKLLDTSMDRFPEIGERPNALWAAYALLQWARDEVGIDGLTAHEIQAFLTMKAHLAYASQAYAMPMGSPEHHGEVEIVGDHPQVFRLTHAGEQALRAELTRTKTASLS